MNSNTTKILAEIEEVMKVRQVIIVNMGVGMTTGQIAAQTAHAAMLFLCNHLKRPFLDLTEEEGYFVCKSFTKVVLQVGSTEELLQIEAKAKEMGIQNVYTMVEGSYGPSPVVTALALGPDQKSRLDKVTRPLRLL